MLGRESAGLDLDILDDLLEDDSLQLGSSGLASDMLPGLPFGGSMECAPLPAAGGVYGGLEPLRWSIPALTSRLGEAGLDGEFMVMEQGTRVATTPSPSLPLPFAVAATAVASSAAKTSATDQHTAKVAATGGAAAGKRKARKAGGVRAKVPAKRARSKLAGVAASTPAAFEPEKDEDENGEKLSPAAKKHRRLVRNRMSAQLHRERKKAYLEGLQGAVEGLTKENARLKGLTSSLQLRVDALEHENTQLRGAKRGHAPSFEHSAVRSDEEGAHSSGTAAFDSDTSDTTDSGGAEPSEASLLPAPARAAVPVARSPGSSPSSAASGAGAGSAGSGSSSGAAARMAMVPTALLACVLCFNVMNAGGKSAGIGGAAPGMIGDRIGASLGASLADALAPHRAGAHGRVLLSTAAATIATIAPPPPHAASRAAEGAVAFGAVAALAAESETERSREAGRALVFRAGRASGSGSAEENSHALSVFDASQGVVANGVDARFTLPPDAARALRAHAENEKVQLYGVDGAESSGSARRGGAHRFNFHERSANASFVMCPHAHSEFATPALAQLKSSQLYGPVHGYRSGGSSGSGAGGAKAGGGSRAMTAVGSGSAKQGLRGGMHGEWARVAAENESDAPFLLVVVPSSSVTLPSSPSASGKARRAPLDGIAGFNGKSAASGDAEDGAEWVEIGCQMLMARPFWPEKATPM